ncbi:uncharacterized protein A1O9_03198 [Exophiala aquamarina CBS 119918]|uniref:Nuclear distribution protein RO10 n=1 Tax=Exophiala aquamarina CBS 119918 TaxID=1182545 RepID=A0A072Q148_9EURO|nr:uncharacterized protein A1O9_03198 [Exophiala aquamarina CBS 119918]KEF61630.1 hypothetical protein A1O9_03198 [Exophiala aquamarina CBS 119918]
MSVEATEPEVAARATLALLETRLHRLEFLLTGKSNESGNPPSVLQPASGNDTIRSKLNTLEDGLRNLKNLNGPAGLILRDIDRLSSTHADLFDPLSKPDSNIPKSEDFATLASIVLSHATLYPETASRLSSLQTLQIPPAEQSSKLIALSPGLEESRKVGRQMEQEVRELRERSVRCLEWWVKIGVVGMGEMWEDWETRIADVERNVIRWERRARDEQGYL